jgi:hypothetical protein
MFFIQLANLMKLAQIIYKFHTAYNKIIQYLTGYSNNKKINMFFYPVSK